MPSSPPKPVVTSWDVFDTLVARFRPHPHEIFRIVEESQGVRGFAGRRLEAQAALDQVGEPYVLYDIYRRMAADGTAPADARALLDAELAAERDQLVPIRRNVLRVEPTDLIVSDTYLSPEMVSAFLFETCDLQSHRPIVRSNWGKHTGTIWPLVLGSYVIRRHVGDNPHADVEVPSRFGVACELAADSSPTAWEMKLDALGLTQLALILREVRLRTIPPSGGRFHAAVIGPYLTILAGFALYLVDRFGADAEFAFLSRGADEMRRVFVSMFPAIPARSLDISRRLAGDAEMAPLFAGGVTPSTVVVDMTGTGRSFFRFWENNGHPGRGLILFSFLDLLLGDTQRREAEQRHADGRLMHVFRVSGGPFWCFEHLLQAPYPPVGGARLDTRSGGVVRVFGAPELDRAEAELVDWKSSAVIEFVKTLRRRGLSHPGGAAVMAAMENALQTILDDTEIMAPFTSFAAREKMDWG